MSEMKIKMPFIDDSVRRKIKKINDSNSPKVVTTYSRSTTILPFMVGFVFNIHNGKEFIKLFVTEEMIGKKLGEFAVTRKFKSHGGDKDAARAAAAKNKGGKKK